MGKIMRRITYGENGNPDRRKPESSNAGNRSSIDYRRKTDHASANRQNVQHGNSNSEIRARGRKRDHEQMPEPIERDQPGKKFG